MFWGGGGVGPYQLNPKCQDLSKSECFGGVGGMVHTNSTQSAKICPNLNVLGRWGVVHTNSAQSAKISPNLNVFRRWGDGPHQLNPKCKDLYKSELSGGEGGAKICPNLHFRSRPTFLKYLSRGTQGILSKIFAKLNSGSPCPWRLMNEKNLEPL